MRRTTEELRPKERYVPTTLWLVDQPHGEPSALARLPPCGRLRRAPFPALSFAPPRGARQFGGDAPTLLAAGSLPDRSPHDAQLQPHVVRVLPLAAHEPERSAGARRGPRTAESRAGG